MTKYSIDTSTLGSLLRDSRDAVLITDEDGKVLEVLGAPEKIFGINRLISTLEEILPDWISRGDSWDQEITDNKRKFKILVQKTKLDEGYLFQIEHYDKIWRQAIEITNETIDHAIFAYDNDNRYVYVNRYFASLHGITPDEIIGKTTYDLFDADVARKFDESNEVVKATRAPKIYNVQAEIQGELQYSVTTIAPVIHLDEVLGVVGVAFNTTDLRILEQSIYDTQRVESLGRLTGGIAHDINNLLASISGYCEIILEDNDCKTANLQYIEKILSVAQRGKQLIEKLMGLSRRGKHVIQPVLIPDIIQEAVEILQPNLKTFNVNFTKEGSCSIDGDPTQILQVFINLIINAIEAMGNEGELIIRYLCKNKEIKIEIEDTGPGIKKEIADLVFQPFFTTKHDKKKLGTGLGLSTVAGIVKNHNGRVTFESEGEGTTFILTFPRGSLKVNQDKGSDAQITEKMKTTSILIVDDEAEIRNVLSIYLKRKGHTVYLAENGTQGIALYKKYKPEITILDYIMPDIIGSEVFKQIRNIHSNAKVLISTGFGKDGAIQEMLDLGVNEFLLKPFGLHDLRDKLFSLLSE
ncbi:MAG: response regulator [Candidatus Heimdallarchaeota archaeon]|nr:response regulator [Candidatus Heimdallarchaeota archaeon]